MQTTESRQGDNLVDTPRRGRCPSTTGSVLLQSEMSPVLVVITNVVLQQSSQVSLIQNNDVIEQVAPYAANPALRNSILPGTAECDAHWLGDDCLLGCNDIWAELRVAVEDQEALRLLAVFPRFAQLQGNPKRGGITRYVVVKDSTTVVADDEKAVDRKSTKRGYGEEVHRGNGLAMVPQERQPALRWVWSSGRSPKPSRDRRL